MFEAMMGQIEDDFVRYVFHLQVVVDEQPAARSCATCSTARRGPGAGLERDRGARWPPKPARDGPDGPSPRRPMRRAVRAEPVAQQPVRVEKTPGRNEPCFCGSGKKYKLCHGR